MVRWCYTGVRATCREGSRESFVRSALLLQLLLQLLLLLLLLCWYCAGTVAVAIYIVGCRYAGS